MPAESVFTRHCQCHTALSVREFLTSKGIAVRISWLGHLERMEEDRMPKKIFTQELEGTRRRGRPRKGWKEEVERDLQVLGVRRWRELVADRKKMEGHCSTGQSPQWAVVPMEEEEEEEYEEEN